jgi:hypothetical protein
VPTGIGKPTLPWISPPVSPRPAYSADWNPWHILFKPFSHSVKVLIDSGHGWRKYDSAKVAGNYAIVHARAFWNSLIKQGFTTNYET